MCNSCWLAVCIVVVVLCILLSSNVYLLYCVCIAVFTLDAGLLARSQYSEGPATCHLDTGFSWFPCVYKQTLRRFPRFQVATTCFLCSPPDLNCCHLMCICCTVCIAVFTLDAGLLARSQYSEGPATCHIDTSFSWFPCVYQQMLRWFPTFQVATTCFSCSPPDLNSVLTEFMFCIHVK